MWRHERSAIEISSVEPPVWVERVPYAVPQLLRCRIEARLVPIRTRELHVRSAQACKQFDQITSHLQHATSSVEARTMILEPRSRGRIEMIEM